MRKHGIINIICISRQPLDDAAKANALLVITEAKTVDGMDKAVKIDYDRAKAKITSEHYTLSETKDGNVIFINESSMVPYLSPEHFLLVKDDVKVLPMEEVKKEVIDNTGTINENVLDFSKKADAIRAESGASSSYNVSVIIAVAVATLASSIIGMWFYSKEGNKHK